MAEIVEPSDAEIREQLSRSESEIRALPADAFAEKHRLRTEADELRRKLHDLLAPDMEAAAQKWADRAGRKGAHDDNSEEMKARIDLRGETTGTLS